VQIRYAAAILALFAAGLAASLGSTSATGARQAVSQTMDAGFDADGNMYLTFLDGTRIGAPTAPGTVVPAGTYSIVLNNNSLDDLGDPHSFHLSGPGVNLDAGGTVQTTWSATFLPASTYVFQDDDNPSSRDVFGTPGSGATATVAPAPTTTGGSSSSSGTTPKATNNNPLASKPAAASTVFRGTLLATVGPTKLTLTVGGKPVTSLRSGRYKITVTDKSRKGGFTIQRTRQSATTVSSVSFVGKRSATLELAPGQWFFYPTFVGKKNYFVVVRA
jgi:hypothetical protein